MSPKATTLNIQQSESKQWGNNIQITSGGYGAGFVYPIVFQTKVLAVIPFDVNGDWTDDAIPSVHAAWFPDKGSDNNDLRWARIGFSGKNTLWGAYRFIAIGKQHSSVPKATQYPR